jgi:hypothetical protein
MLALGTVWLNLGIWHILGVQGGLVVLAGVRVIVAHRSNKRQAGAADGASTVTKE